jgi:DNA primase catalytic subunit
VEETSIDTKGNVMGQAKLRGTFEQRQKEGIEKRIEREKAYQEHLEARKKYWNEKMTESDKANWLAVTGILESFRQ